MILYQPVVVDYKAKFRPGSLAAVISRCSIPNNLNVKELRFKR